jgi:hypothetical protein
MCEVIFFGLKVEETNFIRQNLLADNLMLSGKFSSKFAGG